jgi:hypothetical protein
LDKSKAVVETTDRRKSPVDFVRRDLHGFFAEGACAAGFAVSETASGDDDDDDTDAGGMFMPLRIQKSNRTPQGNSEPQSWVPPVPENELQSLAPLGLTPSFHAACAYSESGKRPGQ